MPDARKIEIMSLIEGYRKQFSEPEARQIVWQRMFESFKSAAAYQGIQPQEYALLMPLDLGRILPRYPVTVKIWAPAFPYKFLVDFFKGEIDPDRRVIIGEPIIEAVAFGEPGYLNEPLCTDSRFAYRQICPDILQDDSVIFGLMLNMADSIDRTLRLNPN